ncbi:hypothetical protein M5X06_31620 [Paenibacillus alvei]|uniref:DUF6848 domain-containing protein n=1 Tax=Paenibacillus alvei TaxID=44250 RepID=A0ABT4H977_PAEAL|nr:hypothetical protein [Paenibacillus alvei]MCY9765171.1 hypothetical protein [Paenibacillus alvei]MCY9771324.1 hypothetical protein [Paenibacillus alvei]
MAEKTAETTSVETYKAKYGKVYRIQATVEQDDLTSIEVEYFFRKPKTASYDRYIKTTAQSPTKAMRVFILDNVVEEQAGQLESHLDEYPAFALSIGEKLLTMLGLSKDVNLKQL